MTPSRSATGALLAAAAMVCVGSSVAVSELLVDAPLLAAQALRYVLAAVLLLALVRLLRRPLPRPAGVEWLWLLGVAATGLALFNVAVVRGVERAEPAVIGVAVATVPLVLAVGGPLMSGLRPAPLLVAAAGVVTVGALLVQGGGRADATGLGWALVVLLTEAAFTLLAVPVLGRLGPWALSLHASWLAAALLAVLSVVTEGTGAVARLEARHVAASVHLAVVVTALAFVLWYSAVGQLGAARAGLFTGVAPVAAAAGGVALGGPVPAALVWAGIVVVGVGLCLGLAAVPGADGRAAHRAPGRGGTAVRRWAVSRSVR